MASERELGGSSEPQLHFHVQGKLSVIFNKYQEVTHFIIKEKATKMFSKLARASSLRGVLRNAPSLLQRSLVAHNASLPSLASAAHNPSRMAFSSKPKISEAVMVLQEKLSGISQVVGWELISLE